MLAGAVILLSGHEQQVERLQIRLNGSLLDAKVAASPPAKIAATSRWRAWRWSGQRHVARHVRRLLEQIGQQVLRFFRTELGRNAVRHDR